MTLPLHWFRGTTEGSARSPMRPQTLQLSSNINCSIFCILSRGKPLVENPGGVIIPTTLKCFIVCLFIAIAVCGGIKIFVKSYYLFLLRLVNYETTTTAGYRMLQFYRQSVYIVWTVNMALLPHCSTLGTICLRLSAHYLPVKLLHMAVN